MLCTSYRMNSPAWLLSIDCMNTAKYLEEFKGNKDQGLRIYNLDLLPFANIQLTYHSAATSITAAHPSMLSFNWKQKGSQDEEDAYNRERHPWNRAIRSVKTQNATSTMRQREDLS